jgi:hypothetical protein
MYSFLIYFNFVRAKRAESDALHWSHGAQRTPVHFKPPCRPVLSTYEKSLRVYISRPGLFTFRFGSPLIVTPINSYWHVFKLLVRFYSEFSIEAFSSCTEWFLLKKKHYVISTVYLLCVCKLPIQNSPCQSVIVTPSILRSLLQQDLYHVALSFRCS